VGTQNLRLYGGLFAGVVAVSWAAIFIRLAEAPALSVSAWRLLLAAMPVAIFALVRRRDELRRLTRGERVLLALSGVALALHFATWIASLSRTTVASSVALVTTQPVWVALLALVTLRERVSRRGGLATLIATAGGMIIGGADISVSGEALAGDALAVAGAIFGAIYFVAGRRVRPTLSLASYVGVVYSVAAVALVASAAGAGQPLAGFSGRTWLMLALLALVPQLIGHSTLNWSLRYLTAPFVSVVILGEPVISTALAVPILGEDPGWLRIAGGAITLAGVYLAMVDESSRTKQAAHGPLSSDAAPSSPTNTRPLTLGRK
jgi:drug/metabolite transporter (DMT)-like permease